MKIKYILVHLTDQPIEMKSILKYTGVLIISLIIISCSKNEDLEGLDLKGVKPENSSKLYKKSEGIYNGEVQIIQEVFYGKNNRIDSVIRNNVGYFKETFKVDYTGNHISSIEHGYDYESESNPDAYYNFSVNMTNGYIKLEDEKRIFEIFHSKEYIDSTKSINPSSEYSISHNQFFNRNQDDQLVSNGWTSYPDDGETFYYSNFDSNKKPAPLNSVIEIPNDESILYIIFGLKLSKDNPLTIELPFGDTYSMKLQYDEEGYVVQGSFDEDLTWIEQHQYINQ